MPRYKLTVAYDGTWFHGWQKQGKRDTADAEPAEESSDESSLAVDSAHDAARAGLAKTPSRAEPPADQLRTVQAVLERAIQRVVNEPVIITGASRSDAGVHARGQVAAFTTTRDIPVSKIARAISSRLPDDVRVLRAAIVDDDFDPIKGALGKGYRYRVAFGCLPHQVPLFDRHFVARTPHRLDVARMNLAARLLMGEHDFASFARVDHGRETTVRTVFDCKVVQTSSRRCHLDIAGGGFLYNMVRIIMGTLVEVGRGKVEPESMPGIIAAKDRRAAGPTMPPTGLCLRWVRYPEIQDLKATTETQRHREA